MHSDIALFITKMRFEGLQFVIFVSCFQLTGEELKKREDRKNRNRLAAAKCRQKKRSRQDELQRVRSNDRKMKALSKTRALARAALSASLKTR